jgi:hypothetical protein
MAFGISFVDIELLIRLAQNQLAEIKPVLPEPDAAILPEAIIPVLPETSSTSSDSFITKNSAANIVAAATENIPPVALAFNSGAKNQAEENDKVADIVFNLTSETRSSGIRQAPPIAAPTAAVTNNFSGTQALKQNQTDAEILFRSLLEKFRASVVYDYEMSDAVQLEENAERKHKPLETSSRFADLNKTGAETGRKKALRDKENLRQEAFRNENQADDNKKRELLKKIREANKFL